jgi:hypothetical protein
MALLPGRRCSLIAVMALCAFPMASSAQFIVAPNNLANHLGNLENRSPIGTLGNYRYQQVYAASQFSALSGPTLLTQIAFRPSIIGDPFYAYFPSLTIKFSTTSKNPDFLVNTFANNIGPDEVTVFSGGITLSSAGFSGSGGPSFIPSPFDVIINFTTPFLYDPSQGNLLMDTLNLNGPIFEFFDAELVEGDSISRTYTGEGGNAFSPTGGFDSVGTITRFAFGDAAALPEPGVVAMGAGICSVGLMALRRKRRARRV